MPCWLLAAQTGSRDMELFGREGARVGGWAVLTRYRWTHFDELFLSGVVPGERCRAGVGIHTRPGWAPVCRNSFRWLRGLRPCDFKVLIGRFCRAFAMSHGGLGQRLWSGVGWWFQKSGDHRVCSSYRVITLLSLPGKVYSRVLGKEVSTLAVEERTSSTLRWGSCPEPGSLSFLGSCSGGRMERETHKAVRGGVAMQALYWIIGVKKELGHKARVTDLSTFRLRKSDN